MFCYFAPLSDSVVCVRVAVSLMLDLSRSNCSTGSVTGAVLTYYVLYICRNAPDNCIKPAAILTARMSVYAKSHYPVKKEWIYMFRNIKVSPIYVRHKLRLLLKDVAWCCVYVQHYHSPWQFGYFLHISIKKVIFTHSSLTYIACQSSNSPH